MADHGQTQYVSHESKFEDIDESLQISLAKCGSETRTNIIEEICHDYECDKDTIVDARQKLFGYAKNKLEQVLKNTEHLNQDEELDICLTNRHRNTKIQSYVKDVLMLYEYLSGHSEYFPKEILNKQSKFIDILAESKQENRIDMSEHSLLAQVAELANTCRDMKYEIDNLKKLRNVDREKMQILETEICLLKANMNKPNHIENAATQKTITNQGETNTNQHKVLYSTMVQGKPEDNPPKHGRHDSNTQHEEVCNRGVTNQRQHTTPPPKGGGVSHVLNPDGTHTTLLHKNNEISKVTAAKALSGKIVHNDQHNNRPSNNMLRGVRNEKGSALYIQNIAVTYEDDYTLGCIIQEYCQKHGIRVMKYRIFRN